MKTNEICLSILKELEGVFMNIDPENADELVKDIINSDRIFVAGAGRSKLMIQGLAMRLMQLGFNASVVGETTTPAIEPKDLLIIGSGSGETATLNVIAKNAKKAGSGLALITIYPESTIGQLADTIVQINATTTKSNKSKQVFTIQPGASLFEQSLLLFCDAIVIRIIELKKLSESNKIIMKKHANLE